MKTLYAPQDSGTAFARQEGIRIIPAQTGLGPFKQKWPATWLPHVVDELECLLELPRNWNSYGAREISESSVSFTAQLAQELARACVVARPQVSATADGNAVLCWYKGETSVEMEVLPSGAVEFVAMRGDQGEEGTTRDMGSLVQLATQR